MSTLFEPVRAGVRYGPRPERQREPVVSPLEAYLQGLCLARHRGPRTFKAFRSTLRRMREQAEALRQSDQLDRLRQRRTLSTALATAPISEALAIETFAHVIIECQSVLHIELHDEQLYAGWQMLHGSLVEMRTGEGKTLAGALPAITVALSRTPVHVITANDYLATRDSESLRTLYRRFGLSTSSVCDQQSLDERREAYTCNIVHCSNKQIVFDYLRDQRLLGWHNQGLADRLGSLVTGSRPQPLLRGLGFAVIDEADSVLIDDVRTPLVLSEPLDSGTTLRSQAAVALRLAKSLREDVDFRIVASERAIQLSVEGLEAIRTQAARLGGVWQFERYRQELVRQALSAVYLYRIDRDYLVQSDQVILIDEATGRPMPDRKLRQGMHQMLEVKDRCELTDQTEVVATISFQQFFSQYHRLTGMSGTLQEARHELRTVYGLPVVRIPTHRPCRLDRMPNRYCRTVEEQLAHLETRLITFQKAERPVLIGTQSLAFSEMVSKFLTASGLEHQLLNARQDGDEAAIISAAGQPGAITVATNMAGRGADIPLHLRSRNAGGLHVVNMEFNASERIDLQLFGRAARQGDPGSCESLLSLEDSSLKNVLPLPIYRWFTGINRRSRKSRPAQMRALFWLARVYANHQQSHTRMELFYTHEHQIRQLAVGGR